MTDIHATDPTSRVFKALIPPVVLIVLVLGSILSGIATPAEAAAVGTVGSILLAGLKVDDNSGLPNVIFG